MVICSNLHAYRSVFQRKIAQFISEEKLKETVAYLDNDTVAIVISRSMMII